MQGVAAAWLMTSLTSSPVPVALLTTMSNLPLFLIGLPAGAIADMLDRRWLVILTQIWMLAVAILLGVLTILGLMTPALLLLLTFLISLGGALSAPAWQAIMPELVPRRELPTAIALNSAGFNLARATGPAVGGLIVAASGPSTVFWLNAASFLGVIFVIYFWKPVPREQSALPEQMGSAIAAGMRFARHSPPLRAVLVRTLAWMFPASALLALLPVVATQELGLDATGYGIMLASLGLGAVAGAVALPRLRARMSIDRLVVTLTLVFVASMVGLALLQSFIALNLMLMLAGVGWLTINSFLNVAAQTTTPGWVQARVLGVYLLVSQGALAGGSAAWGLVAERFDTRTALLAAAVLLLLGLATVRRWPLGSGEELDLRPSQHWPHPELAITLEPSAGPVLVTVEYQVELPNQAAFYEAMAALEIVRRRDGARRWGVFRDTVDLERILETFVVASWGEHMRQHERGTITDRAVEERVHALQKPGTTSVVAHLIAPPNVAKASRFRRRAR